MAARPDGRRRGLATYDGPRLWLLAVVLFGIGDLATTGAGIGIGLHELNPFPRGLIRNYGLGAILVAKLVSLVCCGALWAAAPRPHRVGVPLGLVALGGAVTAWNLVVLILEVLV